MPKMSENEDATVLFEKAAVYLNGLGRKGNVFELSARDAVLLAVDMQNFVCRPEAGSALPAIERVIGRMNLLVDFCHVHAIPVIWLRHGFTQKNERDDVGLYRFFHKQPLDPAMFNQGEITEIYAGMHLDLDQDFVIGKNRYSAFATGSSRLESLLAGWGRRQLILGGVATNVCVESTARDAMQRGYQVTVLADATTTFDNLVHQVSLLNIKLFFGDTRPVDSVIRELTDSL